MEQYH